MQRLQAEGQSARGQISNRFRQAANAAAAKSAADKAEAAADKRKAAAGKAHKKAEKELRDRLALRAKILANDLAAAKLPTDTSRTLGISRTRSLSTGHRATICG